MSFPLREYLFYAGVDPGFSGAIAVMNATGTSLHVFDMPVTYAKEDRKREIDLDGLRDIFKYLKQLPDCGVGIEWPTTRPGEGAERCERFGRGKGYLEAFAFLSCLDYWKIAPNRWCGRLNLPGKDHEGAIVERAGLFEQLYPAWAGLIRGPRGGVLDGRLDALLIAHCLRIGLLTGVAGNWVLVAKKMKARFAS